MLNNCFIHVQVSVLVHQDTVGYDVQMPALKDALVSTVLKYATATLVIPGNVIIRMVHAIVCQDIPIVAVTRY
jgi:hypothetical protein